MSSKTSCFYFRPSNVFLILSVIFLVSTSTSVVFGQSVECYCEAPEDDKTYATRAEYACNGRSTITCSTGGCSTVDITYTAPGNLKGKKAIAKGCKTQSFLKGCGTGTGDTEDGVKSTLKTCFCEGNLCNDKASPSKGNGSVYLRGSWSLLTSCFFFTTVLSLVLFNRK